MPIKNTTFGQPSVGGEIMVDHEPRNKPELIRKLNQIYPMKMTNPMALSIQRNPLGIKNGT
jgi:hypothetical protein